jgi:WD40 repeat protein
LFQHRAEVYGASFSPDGKRVLTACQDGTAQVWDATNGALIGPPLRHAGPVRHAAFSPDGRRVLTASGDPLGREGEARAWAAATGQPLTPWLRHNGAVRSVAFSPDGTRILTAGGDRLVKLWGPPAGGPAARSLRGRVTGMRVPLSPDGRLVLGGEGNRAQVWDTVTGARVGPDLPHSQPVSAGLFAADGRRLVTFCPRPVGQAEARVWELPAGRPLAESVRGWVSALSADGRLLVTIDGDTAQVREADTGAPVGPALKHDRPVHLVAFSPDGRLLATVAYSKVHLWEVTTGKLVVAPLRHEYTVVSIQFSADGRRLVTASYLQGRPGDLIGEGEARVWDVARGEPAGVPLKHRGAVTEAHFSPDPEGRRVLTAGSDRTARVWDTATSRPLTPPLVHPGSVTQARFSPDGRYALTVSDGAARVWDAATGDPVTPPLLGKVKAQTAAFGPGGRSLTVAGFGQNTTEVEGWALRPDALPAAEWMRRARLLAGRELDATGGLVPLVPERLCEELAKQPQPAVRAREDKMPR